MDESCKTHAFHLSWFFYLFGSARPPSPLKGFLSQVTRSLASPSPPLLPPHAPMSSSSWIENKVLCFSGRFDAFQRQHVERLVKEHGGTVVDSVTQNVSVFVRGARPSPTKVSAAQAFGIDVIGQDEFLSRVGIHVARLLRAGVVAGLDGMPLPGAESLYPELKTGVLNYLMSPFLSPQSLGCECQCASLLVSSHPRIPLPSLSSAHGSWLTHINDANVVF